MPAGTVNAGPDGNRSVESLVAGQRLDRLPLAFVPNRGQHRDDAMAFAVQGPRAALAFAADGVRYRVRGDDGRAASFMLRFVGGREVAPSPGVRGSATVSYFRGDDAIAALPTYESIEYREVWPGIDIVFSGDQRRLKYAFRIARDADPSQIRLGYSGHTGLVRDQGGAVMIETPVGPIRDDPPVAQQTIAGRTVDVPVSFTVDATSAIVGFQLGAYDHGRPLLIDPAQLLYAGFVGGSQGDVAGDVAVDTQGNAYLAGTSASPGTEFPDGDGFGGVPSLNPTLRGGDDAFVVKINPAGTALVYATFIGGSSTELSDVALAVDGSGAAYLAGGTSSDETTFPIGGALTGSSFDATSAGSGDGFLVKLAPSGAAIAYAGFLGGTDLDWATGVAVDAAGNAYVAGRTSSSTGFTAISGGFDTSLNDLLSGGTGDAFVVKVNAAGTATVYGTYIGGGGSDAATDIAVDAAGAAYVVGDTDSSGGAHGGVGFGGFPNGTSMAGITTFNAVLGGAFAAKLVPAGTSLAYAGFIGSGSGSGFDTHGRGIAVDTTGAAYVVGDTDTPQFAFPTESGFGNTITGPDTFYNGNTDGYIVKLAPAGTQIAYAGYVGGGDFDRAWDVSVDSAGRAHVVGETQSTETTFPDGDGLGALSSFDPTYNTSGDGFLVRIAASGAQFDLAGFIGGDNDDAANAVALDGSGSVYVAGRTGSPASTFPSGGGIGALPSFDPSGNGGFEDGFAVKIATAADLGVTAKAGLSSVAVGQQVPVTVTVTNAGPASVGAVAVSIPVPAGVSVASAAPSAGSCALGATVTCQLGALSPGASASIAVTAASTAAGAVTATALVSSELEDPNGANGQAPFGWQARVPGGLAVQKPRVSATWKLSRLRGSVTLAGTTAEPVVLQVALERETKARRLEALRKPAGNTKPCRLAVGRGCPVELAAGTFSKELRFADRVLPGTYVLMVTGQAGDGLPVPGQRLVIEILAPPEGVVQQADVAACRRCTPSPKIPATAKEIIVTFRFATLPKKRRISYVVRYPDGTSFTRPFFARRIVSARQRPPFLAGKWTFTLLAANGKPIARTGVTVTQVPT